jgi:hypothetical protein
MARPCSKPCTRPVGLPRNRQEKGLRQISIEDSWLLPLIRCSPTAQKRSASSSWQRKTAEFLHGPVMKATQGKPAGNETSCYARSWREGSMNSEPDCPRLVSRNISIALPSSRPRRHMERYCLAAPLNDGAFLRKACLAPAVLDPFRIHGIGGDHHRHFLELSRAAHDTCDPAPWRRSRVVPTLVLSSSWRQMVKPG